MNRIPIKTEAELEALRQSANLLVQSFRAVETLIRPGVTTQELNDFVRKVVLDGGGEPAFIGYQGYPADICVSINEEVVHGIPGKRKIKTGDLVSIDMGINLNGYFSDAAKTYAVGQVSDENMGLLETTRDAVKKGIGQCRVGKRVSDISHAIQICVESQGFSVVRNLVGHGIGRALHEEPQIPNYGPPHRGAPLKAGMVFAIEAMVNMGSYEVETLQDGWTVRTADGLLSAHFEHTIAITDGKPEILTLEIENNGGLIIGG
jgi:methionyl aminopeptidase